MRVSPDTIRETARAISERADEWSAAVQTMSEVPTEAFGGDSIGQMIQSFHGRTHQPSVQYYTEVGACAADVGTALHEVADLYADTELDNAARARSIETLVEKVGTF